MRFIILNAKSIKTKEELHEQLKKAFDFPDYYGKNLSALHDMLTEPRKKTCVIFKNLEKDEGPLSDAYQVFADAAQDSSWLSIMTVK